MRGHGLQWINKALWVAAMVVFALPLFVAPLGFPPYYEDESWVFLPAFELLRGNGPSMGAFSLGPVPFVVHTLAVAPVVALSPFPPELTVRAISTIIGLFCAAGTAALGQRIAPHAGALAIALFILVPMLYATGRYGRTDMLALGFGLWGMAAAGERPVVSGILCALAVCTHPVMIWVLPPAVIWNWREPDGISRVKRFGIAVSVIALAQLAWLLANFDQMREFIARMFVSSTVSKPDPFAAIASSLIREADRYIAYWNVLGPLDRLLQGVLLGMLGAAAVVVLATRRQAAPILMLVGSALAIAILVGAKNLYYLVFLLPLLAAIAPAALDRLPRAIPLALAAVLIGWTGLRQAGAAQAANGFNISRVTAAMANQLPQGAVVVLPMIDAGLVRLRPDLRYYSFHALSDHDAWRLPSCGALPQRIADVVESDGRPYPAKPTTSPREAYVGGIAPGGLVEYLRGIYSGADADIEACLFNGPRVDVLTGKACQNGEAACSNAVLAKIALPPPSLFPTRN